MAALEGAVQPAQDMIATLRQVKSPAEIAIIQTAMDASWQVQRAVQAGLRPGIGTTEVAGFINAAHRALGLKPLFAAVQFGEATAYPHGVPDPQTLTQGDMVLVDMGGTLQGYQSDITRTYVFGPPSPRQRQLVAAWNIDAQAAAFAAAQIGDDLRGGRCRGPRGADRRPGSGPATRCRVCRIAPGTGLAWISTKSPIS